MKGLSKVERSGGKSNLENWECCVSKQVHHLAKALQCTVYLFVKSEKSVMGQRQLLFRFAQLEFTCFIPLFVLIFPFFLFVFLLRSYFLFLHLGGRNPLVNPSSLTVVDIIVFCPILVSIYLFSPSIVLAFGFSLLILPFVVLQLHPSVRACHFQDVSCASCSNLLDKNYWLLHFVFQVAGYY